MKHISILAFENTLGTSIVMPMEIWYIANLIFRKQKGDSDALRFDVVTRDGRDVTGFSGIPIQATASIDQVTQTDSILVSGVWKEIDAMLQANRTVIPWLVAQYEKGASISSVSTGTFLIAEAGLLDGREATIYWKYVDLFRKRYPRVRIKPEKMVTTQNSISCYCGLHSGCDLALYVIEQTYGVAVARQVERYYLFDSARVYQPADISFLGQTFHKDRKVLEIQQWIENNYAATFLMEEVAMRFGMSLRNFTRRFKLATGESPLNYLHRFRIEVAKQLLRTSSRTIQEIALQIGYEDISFFYRLFRKYTALTPKAYRSRPR